MSDFTSNFWSWWIIAISVGGIVWCFWLLTKNKNTHVPVNEQGKPMQHIWDGDLQELNNPMPRWWISMFYITLFFAVAYLALYPGLGVFKGLLGWSQTGQYDTEMAQAKQQYGPLYDKYLKQDLVALAADNKAMKTGERLFVNYCSVCHGSDARGARGFPNLRDNDWLYGGEAETIQTTIMYGRNGVMPAWQDALGGDEGVDQVAAYVMGLSGRDQDAGLAQKGKEKFDMLCVACHMPDGTGNHAIGAPNLTDNIWLYGGTPSAIKRSIAAGRNGHMPAHSEFLGEARVHVLAAYVYSLSHENKE
jgi:cytochrome c oxidase cbb3-type subunit 3